MGLACGGAVIGIIVAKAGIASAPLSAGSSLAATYIAYTAAAASALQCAASSACCGSNVDKKSEPTHKPEAAPNLPVNKNRMWEGACSRLRSISHLIR